MDNQSVSTRIIPLPDLSFKDMTLIEQISEQSEPISPFHSSHWVEAIRSFATHKSHCLFIYLDGKPSGYLLFELYRTKMGIKILKSPALPSFTPYGGLVLLNNKKINIGIIIQKLGTMLKCKYAYILGNPFMEISDLLYSKCELGYAETSVINLRMSDEELFRNLHGKTRNMIRKGEKSRICIADEGSKAIPIFVEMLESTLTGTSIDLPPSGFFEKLYAYSNTFISVLIARFNSKPISGIVILHHNSTSYYWLGASFEEGKRNGCNELLQWNAIQLAKKFGSIRYDMVRIDRKRLPGITRFKLRFGGEICKIPVFTWRSKTWQCFRSAKRILTLRNLNT